MTNEQEQKLKAMAAEQQMCSNGASIGYTGRDQLATPGLRERIHSQLSRAQREARTADQLMELAYLMDKHPDFARILELMEAVGK